MAKAACPLCLRTQVVHGVQRGCRAMLTGATIQDSSNHPLPWMGHQFILTGQYLLILKWTTIVSLVMVAA